MEQASTSDTIGMKLNVELEDMILNWMEATGMASQKMVTMSPCRRVSSRSRCSTWDQGGEGEGGEGDERRGEER